MKHIKVVFAAVALLGFATGAGAQQATQGQIVFLNAQQAMAGAPGAREAQQTLEREMTQLRTQVQQMEATLDSLVANYEQRQVMLSPEARREMQDTIRARQREYQGRAQQLEQRMSERQAELIQPIMARVQQVVDALRAERGYALVLDAGESGIVSADPALDITQEVLTRLRAATSSN